MNISKKLIALTTFFLFPAVANAMSDVEMGSARAGFVQNTNNVTSNQTLNSSSSGNSVNVTGDLINGSIAAEFGGSGFGSYVMNTGNNAVINSGVSLSVLTVQQ